MHPAFSIILFTVLSGAGFGLLVWVGLNNVLFAPVGAWTLFAGAALGAVLAGIGLISSTAHLGHPERAWRAFSQWRSSWLSREGVLAVATFPLAGGLVLAAFFDLVVLAAILGLVTALVALATLFCTAMIYASLKAVPAWHSPWVPAAYLALGSMSGLLAWIAVCGLAGEAAVWPALVAAVLIVAGWGLKLGFWTRLDRGPNTATHGSATPGTATGLGGLGRVRQLEAPHTGANYLMKEMGYQVARKHAAKLRLIAQGLGFAVPLVLVLAGLIAGPLALAILAAVALLAALAGLLVERWLFFAEAQHVVTLFYGRPLAGNGPVRSPQG